MLKNRLSDIINDFQENKLRIGFNVIDCHVHPFDVMGVVEEKISNNVDNIDYTKPGISEILGYGYTCDVLTSICTKYFDRFSTNSISWTYRNSNVLRLKNEMSASCVDKSVLLPIEPWSSFDHIYDMYQGKQEFILFGSIDLHLDFKEIEKKLFDMLSKKIKGLKLHPNLQDFYPTPEHNDSLLSDKLNLVYDFASQNQLPILIHVGKSFFQRPVLGKYSGRFRSREKAVLENFIDSEMKINILERYGFKIIFAHAAGYGIRSRNWRIIHEISKRYSNLFFDTAGVSSPNIRQLLNCVNTNKIIFGSDALYNKMTYSLAFLVQAINAYTDKNIFLDHDRILSMIFSSNLLNLIE